MTTPTDRRYSESHEWFLADGDAVTIGITQHAADELTDITYVEMLPQGTSIDEGASLGEVESVKTTSEVMSAIPGEVTEVNQGAIDDPALVNSDPYGAGWLVRIHATNLEALEALMDAETYESKYAAH